MIFFATETGSEYQLNKEARMIRRLGGYHSPTRNQGTDGNWQSYLRLEPAAPVRDRPLLIIWRVEPMDGSATAGVIRRTLISHVKHVSEET